LGRAPSRPSPVEWNDTETYHNLHTKVTSAWFIDNLSP
jgi:hypothetical protein